MAKHKITTAFPFLFHRFCSAWDFGVSQTLEGTHKMCQWKELIMVWCTGSELVCIVVFLTTYPNGFYSLYINLLNNSFSPQQGLESCHEASKLVLKLPKSWILLSILHSCRKFLANIYYLADVYYHWTFNVSIFNLAIMMFSLNSFYCLSYRK